jgi:hypothetical protein
MTATPARQASRGVRPVNVSPAMSISPASGVIAPETHLMSVDFPAPLAPRRAWISPSLTVRSTPSSTVTPA